VGEALRRGGYSAFQTRLKKLLRCNPGAQSTRSVQRRGKSDQVGKYASVAQKKKKLLESRGVRGRKSPLVIRGRFVYAKNSERKGWPGEH